MKRLLSCIKRYCSLFLLFAKNSLVAQLEYRINFISSFFVEVGFMVAKLTYVLLIYKIGVDINGMSPDYILIFIGTYAIMTGIYMSFYSNLWNISGYIKDGTLDVLITKPVSLLFITSFRYIDFAMPIPAIVGGTVMVIIGWTRCGIAVSLLNIVGFCFFLVSGTVLTYAIFLLPRLLSFWIVSSNGVSQICDSAWDFNNMPMSIYNRVIKNIGSFLFPVFLITNLPGLFLKGLDFKLAIWGILAPILFFLLALFVWKRAMKRYTSASS